MYFPNPEIENQHFVPLSHLRVFVWWGNKYRFLSTFKIMFFSNLFNNRLHFLVVTVRHIREKMMLHLIINLGVCRIETILVQVGYFQGKFKFLRTK